MTFQEAFTKHKKIVFHGHEKGYYLLSFDDETEVRRIPNREIKEVTDQMRTPEEREQDRRHEETTLMVNEEMRKRAGNCVLDIGFCLLIEVALLLGLFFSVRGGHMNSLYVLCPAMAVVAVTIWRRNRELDKIHAFFRWRKEQEEEWG